MISVNAGPIVKIDQLDRGVGTLHRSDIPSIGPLSDQAIWILSDPHSYLFCNGDQFVPVQSILDYL
jgi:hypothetical protein